MISHPAIDAARAQTASRRTILISFRDGTLGAWVGLELPAAARAAGLLLERREITGVFVLEPARAAGDVARIVRSAEHTGHRPNAQEVAT